MGCISETERKKPAKELITDTKVGSKNLKQSKLIKNVSQIQITSPEKKVLENDKHDNYQKKLQNFNQKSAKDVYEKVKPKAKVDNQTQFASNQTQVQHILIPIYIQPHSESITIPQQSIRFSRPPTNQSLQAKVQKVDPSVNNEKVNSVNQLTIQQKPIAKLPSIKEMKQNKQNLNKQQILKRYEIKRQKSSQKILNINSFKYETLISLNPQNIDQFCKNQFIQNKLQE